MGIKHPMTTSAWPHEPDVLVCVRFGVLRGRALRFLACASAARRFADYWATYRTDRVTFEPPDRTCPRLPYEQLWTLQ